jgi:hypothetical protein
MAQELMRPEYAQNSGALGALAMIAQTYAGKRMRKKADESASEYAGRIFEEEQRQAAAQAGAEAKAQEAQLARQWAREDQRDETRAQREERLAMLRIDAADRRAAQTAEARIAAARIGASAAAQGRDANPIATKVANAEAALGRPLSDAERAELVGLRAPAAAQASSDPVAIREARASAESAVEVLNRVRELEGLLNSGKNTGPLARFIPGSDSQKFEAVSNALNVASLRSRFGGNPTEGEREANLATLPNLARNEDVNLDLIKAERDAAIRRIEAYNAMPGVTPIPIPEALRPVAPAAGPANVDSLLEKYR